MATQTQPSTLEQLDSLLEQRAVREKKWREELPAQRAKMLATGIILDELARTSPLAPPPRRRDVEVALAAPDTQWAKSVAARLSEALPGARVMLGEMPEQPPQTALPVPFRVACLVSGVRGRHASQRVRAALEQMDDLKTAYSSALKLIVVSPRG